MDKGDTVGAADEPKVSAADSSAEAAPTVRRWLARQLGEGVIAEARQRLSLELFVALTVHLAVGLLIALPICLGSALLAFGGGVWFAFDKLNERGTLRSLSLGDVQFLAGAILAAGIAASLWRYLEHRLRPDRAGGPSPVDAWTWWWLFGGMLFLVRTVAVKASASMPAVAAALLIALVGWLALTVTYLLGRVCWSVLRRSATCAVRSPYYAGLSTAFGAMACVVPAALLVTFGTLDDGAKETVVCNAGLLECARRDFLELKELFGRGTGSGEGRHDGPGAGTGLVFGAFGASASSATTAEQKFRECLERALEKAELRERARRLAWRMTDSSTADDLVYTAMLKVCMRKPEPDEFESYYLKVVANLAREWKRNPRNAKSCAIDDVDPPSCELGPDEELGRAEHVAALRASLCSLEPGDRRILELRYYEGRGEYDIAAELNISYDNARQRLSRARKRLRERFFEQCR